MECGNSSVGENKNSDPWRAAVLYGLEFVFNTIEC